MPDTSIYSVRISLRMVWEEPPSTKAPHGHQWTRPIELDVMFESQKDISRMLGIAKKSISGVMNVLSVEIDEDPRHIVIRGTRSDKCNHPSEQFGEDVKYNYQNGADTWMEGDISMPVNFSTQNNAEVFFQFVSCNKDTAIHSDNRKQITKDMLKGKNVVLSGTFDPKFKSIVERTARLQVNVTKLTDMLIVRNMIGKSTKRNAAEKYGIRIIASDTMGYI